MSGDETRASGRAQVVRYAKTHIAVTAGPDTGARIEVAGSLVRIGTAVENDLVLHDDSVSRRHCEIESGVSGVRVRDVGSRNGVWLGGVRIVDAILDAPLLRATALTLGDSQLTISEGGGTVDRLQATSHQFGDVIGASARMRELFADLDRISATDLTLLDPKGARPILPADSLLVVVPDFLVNPKGNQDGYTMLTEAQVIADGPELKALLTSAFTSAGQGGVSPVVDGRVCNPQRGGPCLAVSH